MDPFKFLGSSPKKRFLQGNPFLAPKDPRPNGWFPEYSSSFVQKQSFGAFCQGMLGLKNSLPTSGFSVLSH